MPGVNQRNLEAALVTLRQAGQVWAQGNEHLRVTHESATKTLVGRLEVAAIGTHDIGLRRLATDTHGLLHYVLDGFATHVEPTRQEIVRAINQIRSTLGVAEIHDQAWSRARSTIATRSGTDVPDEDASVEEIHTWWNGLDAADQATVMEQHGNELRRVDGIDVPARSVYNEKFLVDERTRLKKERDALESETRGGWWRKRQRKKVIGDLTEKIGGLDYIKQRLADERERGREAYLIDLDTSKYGTFRFSYGNPQKTKRVVTYVPGCGTYLGKAKGALEDSANLLEMVERLQGPDAPHDTAVITSLYHITKPVEPAILGMWVPDAAAAPLARFQHGLRVTHEPVAEGEDDTTYDGVHHSLGNVAAALAAQRHGYDVDRFTINGVGWAGAKHADDLGVPEVYATLMPTDPLTLMPPIDIPRRGPQPAWKRFGAKTFDSGPGKPSWLPRRKNLDSHFAYLRDEVTLLNNAEIILGNEPHHRAPALPPKPRRRLTFSGR